MIGMSVKGRWPQPDIRPQFFVRCRAAISADRRYVGGIAQKIPRSVVKYKTGRHDDG